MRKTVFYSLVIALLGSGTFALHSIAQKQKGLTSPLANMPSASGSQLTVLARTDYDRDGGGNLRHYCFKQDNTHTLYFNVKGTGGSQSNPAQVHLDLYNLKDVSTFDLTVQIDQQFVTDANDLIIGADNAPHLGAGPYVAEISSVGSTRLNASAKQAFYYYETFVNSTNECAYSKGK